MADKDKPQQPNPIDSLMQSMSLLPGLPMQTEQVLPSDISAAALKVCSRDELMKLPEQVGLSLFHLISKRLKEPGPPPTVPELEGIRDLVLHDLWHPALNALSSQSPASTTANSETSD